MASNTSMSAMQYQMYKQTSDQMISQMIANLPVGKDAKRDTEMQQKYDKLDALMDEEENLNGSLIF